MKQTLKSQKSKEMILAAGLALFSSQGYKATSMKEISEKAGISIGRVYHHYKNKLEIFTSLIDEYWERLTDPALKLNVLHENPSYPDDFRELVYAIREIVEDNRAYIMLIYVDVIEFQGQHIQRFYRDMANRFRQVYGARFRELSEQDRLNSKADPTFSIMLVYRFFFHYFVVETSFGVSDHFGFSTDDMVEQAQEHLLRGLLKQEGSST